jgi:N6-adenosine-specific RNA methylase IME4
MRAWGFEYKASFIWDKVKHNFGHYNSVRHELLLIGTRGSCLPDAEELVDSVQSIARSTEHSSKPGEFRDIIDKLYRLGTRVELFARGDMPEGWLAWGAEVDG